MSYTRDGSSGTPQAAGRSRVASFRAALALASLAFAAAVPAYAQTRGGVLTLAQVERRYPAMSVIHIEKCDKGRDGLYDRGEMACVGSIYDVMYRSD